jgi:hypothetical protein
MRMFKFFIPTIALFLFSSTAHAASDVHITEVMYDLGQTEEGITERYYEWVEICNTGDSSVTLTDWKLSENGYLYDKAKSIIPVSSAPNTLAPGSCAIVINLKEGEIYFDDFFSSGIKSGYTSEQLYTRETTFSLNNAGEDIILYDATGVPVSVPGVGADEYAPYKPKTDANGTGKSISWDGEEWCVTDPTPGIENHGCPPNEESEEDDTSSDTEDNINTIKEDSSEGGYSRWIPDPDMYAYAGENREIVAGADVVFEGYAGDATGEIIEKAEYVWNFGDGVVERGKSLIHTYRYPGTYITYLTIISGKHTAHDTVTVVATEPDVRVIGYVRGGLDPYVALRNNASTPINLSWWYIRVAGNLFHVPEHTYIAPNAELRFSQAVMNIDFPETTDVALLYPNLRVVDTFLRGELAGEENVARGVSISESSQTSVPPRATTQIPSQSYAPATISSATASKPTQNEESVISEGRKEEGSSDENMAGEDQTSSVYYSLTANASAAEEGRQAWFFALGGVIILGIAGVSVIHKKGDSTHMEQQKTILQKNDTDEYEIVEE